MADEVELILDGVDRRVDRVKSDDLRFVPVGSYVPVPKTILAIKEAAIVLDTIFRQTRAETVHELRLVIDVPPFFPRGPLVVHLGPGVVFGSTEPEDVEWRADWRRRVARRKTDEMTVVVRSTPGDGRHAAKAARSA